MFVPSLVSAGAIDVNGYQVYTYWKDESEFGNVVENSFQNIISTYHTGSTLKTSVHVDLMETVPANTLFNFGIAIDISDVASAELISTKFYDEQHKQIGTGSYNLHYVDIDSSLAIGDDNIGVVLPSKCRYIIFEIQLNSPSFTVVNNAFDFTINGSTYQAYSNMTWGEWVNSSFDTIGLYVENGKIKGAGVNVYTYGDYKEVLSTDIITEGSEYIYTSKTIRGFNVDGVWYSCYDGMTWSEFINSSFNDGSFTFGYYVNYNGGILCDKNGAGVYPSSLISDVSYRYSSGGSNDWGGMDGPSASYLFTRSATSGVEYTFDFSVKNFQLIIPEEDEEETEKGILAWIKNIVNSIKNLPKNIGAFFQTVMNNALEQIKGFFIPSETTMIELKSKFESLLADRFGAAYQASDIIDDFANAFTYSETKGHITIPEITVNLVGTEFTFGGWDVDIIPDGFEGLQTTLKLVVNIICTVCFVNALKKRFREVLR